MTRIKLPGSEAWSNLYPTRRYANRYGNAWWNDGRSGSYSDDSMAVRAVQKVVYPGAQRIPLISNDSRVFAMGSCFARRIEGALIERGLAQVKGDIGYSNKYNTSAMVQELRWALSPGERLGEEALVERRKERFVNLHGHFSGGQYEGGWETPGEALAFHDALITDSFRAIREADFLVVTLGLIEAWFDKECNLYTTDTPSSTIVDKYPGRFEFRLLDYSTIWSNLEEMFDLISASCRKDFKIFVTVSPIPLTATFTPQRDVLVANTYSKSMSRVLAEEWVWRHPDHIIYFPSFEMVMNSSRDIVWEEDQVHVTASFAHTIVDYFWELYSV